MDRRHFIGGLIAAGSLAAIEKVEASPLVKMAGLKSKKTSKAKFDPDKVVFISDAHCFPGSYQPDYLRKTVEQILSMKPLPANVIALGDLAYLTGQPNEYSLFKEIISPIQEAGINLTLAMGNHDRREVFADFFPEHAAKTKVPGRYVYIVETPHADFIVLDSLQQGEDDTTWITPGALNDSQKEWLKTTLDSYTKPVFVCSHHPLGEVGIRKMLLESKTCCGYIHGHDHRWRPDWHHLHYDSTRLLRSLCLPSTGHWGDIGITIMELEAEKATATLEQSEFFFPRPAADPAQAPAYWSDMVADHKGAICTFNYI